LPLAISTNIAKIGQRFRSDDPCARASDLRNIGPDLRIGGVDTGPGKS